MSLATKFPPKSKSEVRSFYANKTIFVTGASGFLGKLLVEKLLRTCQDLDHIYVLLREKDGKSPQDRLGEIFDVPAFEPLRKAQPNFPSKISIVEGDLELPSLGLSDQDESVIKERVNCIFHVGAATFFDEKPRRSAYVNVRATRDLLRLAKEVKQLKSFVHVSTVYSKSSQTNVDEVFYQAVVTAEKLLEQVDSMDDAALNRAMESYLKDYPNVHIFTKAIAEDLLRGESLPLAIVRASLVTSTVTEPIPAWLDNPYTPFSLTMAGTLGILPSMHGDKSKIADIVPADLVINNMIVSAWDLAQTSIEESPKIYNYVSGSQNPIIWGEYQRLTKRYSSKIPSDQLVWYDTFNVYSNYHLHMIVTFLFQLMPAYIGDFGAKLFGKEAGFVALVKHLGRFSEVITYFMMRQWDFKNENVQNLWNKLNKTDKKLYNFDIASVVWRGYFQIGMIGSRLYLMKEPLGTIPKGRRKYLAARTGHYLLIITVVLLFFKLLMM